MGSRGKPQASMNRKLSFSISRPYIVVSTGKHHAAHDTFVGIPVGSAVLCACKAILCQKGKIHPFIRYLCQIQAFIHFYRKHQISIFHLIGP